MEDQVPNTVSKELQNTRRANAAYAMCVAWVKQEHPEMWAKFAAKALELFPKVKGQGTYGKYRKVMEEIK